MAAKSPISSTSSDRIASVMGVKAPLAAALAAGGKSDAMNALTDEQWLEKSQQAWAERRAEEEQAARAEKAGDRVIQLLEGEQVGESTGPSLVIAQASTTEDERKAAAAKAEGDRRKAAAAQEDDDEGGWLPWIGLGLGGAAIARLIRSSDSDPVDPVDPEEPNPQNAVGLRVYSTEENDGTRGETGSTTDTNGSGETDAGPYNLVRVQAFDDNDSAILDDGSDGSVEIDFIAGDDLTLEVLATSQGAFAEAKIYTSSEFDGEMTVQADGAGAEASLEFYAEGETHTFDLSVEALGDGACADAYFEFDGGANAIDVTISADVVASGDSASVHYSVDVFANAGENVALNGDLSVDTYNTGNDASACVDVDFNIDAVNADATFSGDVTVFTTGTAASVEVDINLSAAGSSADATFEGDIDVQTRGRPSNGAAASSTEVTVNVDASGDVYYEGDAELDTVHQQTYGLIDINIDASYDVYLGGDGVRDFLDQIAPQVDVSTEESSVDAAHLAAVATGQDSSADLLLDISAISADSEIVAWLDVTSQSSRDGATSFVEVSMDADHIELRGSQIDSMSAGASLDTASQQYGEDVSSGKFSSIADANGAYSDFDLYLDGSTVHAETDFLVDADGRSADAEMDIEVLLRSTGATEDSSGGPFGFLGVGEDGGVSNATLSGGEDILVSQESTPITTGGADPITIGEDSSFQFASERDAADWTVSASGDTADASFNLTVTGTDTLVTTDSDYFDVYLNANLTVQADGNSTARAYIDLNSNDAFQDVAIGGTNSFVLDTTGVGTSAEEDYDTTTQSVSTYSISFESLAADWAAVATAGGTASLILGVDADDSVNMQANLGAESGAEGQASVDVSIEGEWVNISGSTHVDVEETNSSYDSGVTTGYTSGEDTTMSMDAAVWQAEANGEGGSAELDANIYASDDLWMAVEAVSTASATDSVSSVYLNLAAGNSMEINGGSLEVWSAISSDASDDVSVDTYSVDTTEYAANWAVTASGTDSYAESVVEAMADDIEVRVNQAVSASGTGSYAYADMSLDASTDIVVAGDRTTSEYGSNDVEQYFSEDTENATWSVNASGDDSEAILHLDASADFVDLDLDLDINAAGENASAWSHLHLTASTDLALGDENGAAFTVTADGAGAKASLEIDAFVGEDLDMYLQLAVSANAVGSIASADLNLWAVDEISLGVEDGASQDAEPFVVSAAGDDSTALLNLYASSDTEDVDLFVSLEVKATGANATASADLELRSNGDDVYINNDDDRTNVDVVAEGDGSSATLNLTAYADDEVHLHHDLTVAAEGDDSTASVVMSLDADNWVHIGHDSDEVFTVTATGDRSTALLDINATVDALDQSGIDLDVDIVVSASGTGSVAQVNLDFAGEDVDLTDDVDGTDFTVTATGVDSLARMVVNFDGDGDFLGEDGVAYSGNITVLASADSGDDASADFVMNLVSLSGDVDFDGVVNVTAIGADNEASLAIFLDGSDDTDMTGELNVTADDGGIATVSVTSAENLDSSVTLTANDGGQVFASLVAQSAGGDISVNTDVDGEVTLDMDVDSFGGDIEVFGDDGVFNLVLQDGFNVNIDLEPTVNYGGQFNLIIEEPHNIDAESAGNVAEVQTVTISGPTGLSGEVQTVTFSGAILGSADFVDGLSFMGVSFDILSTDTSSDLADMIAEAFSTDPGNDLFGNSVASVTASGGVLTITYDYESGDVADASVSFSGDTGFTAVVSEDSAVSSYDVNDGFTFMGVSFDIAYDDTSSDLADMIAAAFSSDDTDFPDNVASISASGEVLTITYDETAGDVFDASFGFTEGTGFGVDVSEDTKGSLASGTQIQIDGFDSSDTINFKGDEFDGYYIDATDTVNSVDYDAVYESLDAFLVDAEEALDGSVDYFFGTDGTNGWLAVDGDGDRVDYLVELVGVTTIDWSTIVSTAGQYDMPG